MNEPMQALKTNVQEYERQAARIANDSDLIAVGIVTAGQLIAEAIREERNVQSR